MRTPCATLMRHANTRTVNWQQRGPPLLPCTIETRRNTPPDAHDFMLYAVFCA